MLYYSLGAGFFISIVSRNSTRLLSTAITLVCLGCSKSDHGFSLAGLMVLNVALCYFIVSFVVLVFLCSHALP